IMGENPAMSDPNLNHAREALAMLEHLVVQDIFFTETAGFADVILPASAFPEKTGTFTNTDRRVQLGRQAIAPPGEARQDLWIIEQMARRLGLEWDYADIVDVFDEMREATPSIAGMTWERLEREDSITYPCLAEGDPGEPILFREAFPTPNGRARFVPAEYTHAAELPDQDYPNILITGRQLEHWHTGSMTRNASVLNAIEPEPMVNVHPDDMAATGVSEGDFIVVESRRGRVTARVRPDRGMQRGSVFMAFCYAEAAANLLTVEELDPFGKIPEFKYCAVRLAPARAVVTA
ncbi:MAG: molybdopterin dinucleotide binding domain-containing protein, partial [Gammaproteobacteria bacterium]